MRPRIQSVIQPAELNEITSQSWTLLNLGFSFPMNGSRWNEGGGGAQALILLQKLTSHKLQLVYIGRILTVGKVS